MIEENLLILHCFGVWHNGFFYGEHPEQINIYEKQLRESFRLLNREKYGVLIISGGYTKKQVEKSEARGMLDWAENLELKNRYGIILLEEFAKDSMENLLFSMCRFFQYFNKFPKTVHSCSWRFNAERFEVFAEKLALPEYAVIPVGETKRDEEIATKWTKLAREDPFYSKQTDSQEKHMNRDPWKKGHPYFSINPNFQQLFNKLEEIRKTGQDPAEVKKLFPWT